MPLILEFSETVLCNTTSSKSEIWKFTTDDNVSMTELLIWEASLIITRMSERLFCPDVQRCVKELRLDWENDCYGEQPSEVTYGGESVWTVELSDEVVFAQIMRPLGVVCGRHRLKELLDKLLVPTQHSFEE